MYSLTARPAPADLPVDGPTTSHSRRHTLGLAAAVTLALALAVVAVLAAVSAPRVDTTVVPAIPTAQVDRGVDDVLSGGWYHRHPNWSTDHDAGGTIPPQAIP